MRLIKRTETQSKSQKRRLRSGRAAVLSPWAAGLMLALGGCAGPDAESGSLTSTQQAVGGFNAGGWNGSGWNGSGWNGSGWNGSGWNGSGWNGSGWNGNAWGGIGTAQDCAIAPNNDSCTTLHDWVNHSDVNGNGTAGDEYDRRTRVQALSYWVSCACDASTAIPFSDTHGLFSTTMHGQFGLAPIWCGSNTNIAVPTSEMEIVSACLMARTNMKGKHVPLSLRSLESGTALSVNEQISHGTPISRYWGNLWKLPHVDSDATTPVSGSLTDSGGTWWNMERFACAEPDTYGDDRQDQAVFGRTCDIDDCGGNLEHVGFCGRAQKRLGESGSWDANNPRSPLYKAVRALRDDPVVSGGLSQTTTQPSVGGTTLATAEYRGRSWRVMSVYRPYTISIERPFAMYPGGNWLGRAWSQIEKGSVTGQSIPCTAGTTECQGAADAGEKLVDLAQDQQITLNLTGNVPPPAVSVPGDPNEPMTVAIRYSRQGLLGPGQCDPDMDCASTPVAACASGVKDANGCVGGAASPGLLRIAVNNIKPTVSSWTAVHGTGSPYGKNIFPPTVASHKYSTAYIYPVYLQDTIATIQGATDHTPGVTYDTLRVRIEGDHVDPTRSPHLDTAYFLAGSPPGDADCKGIGGCWLYAGPSEVLALTQNQEWRYTSPFLPPGSYTFQITGVTNDADLYVKKNDIVSTSSWDCRPYSGSGISETCSVTLTGRGGYLSVMVRGYSATSSVALLGKN